MFYSSLQPNFLRLQSSPITQCKSNMKRRNTRGNRARSRSVSLKKLITCIILVSFSFFLCFFSRPVEWRIHQQSVELNISKHWAVLVAGSKGYDDYRHQADVCHAYQILKKGGLKDENIIVFMYDDIAFNERNPRKGVIINKPGGPNVYQGVPKDYNGENVTTRKFFSVLLAYRSGLTGGSGKVLDSGPDDTIFIYYSDHGNKGRVGMPNGEMKAKDFINVLKKKHEARSYAQMVIYMEACFAGSMFENLLPEDWNIYVTTASNSNENSLSWHCSKKGSEYDGICLGDSYSDAWMEDSETQNLTGRTLKEQFEVVKQKTIFSHVMEYGNKSLAVHSFVSTFMGSSSREKE